MHNFSKIEIHISFMHKNAYVSQLVNKNLSEKY